jgi:ribosomal protein L11 methyltransferase
MPFLSAHLTIDAPLVDAMTDALMEAGAVSVDVSDADAGTAWERPIFDEPDHAASVAWVHARLCALIPTELDVPGVIDKARRIAGIEGTLAFEVNRVDDEDWVRRTQSQFTPQHVTERLWVVPSWHAPPEPHALNIVLDPGLAFGTGTHPTTRLCLRWLERTLQGGESVIDFGCGSGILAIAALKLGAARASGIDIDPQALVAANRNAKQNNVQATFVCSASELGGPAHVVVANILAQPLIVLAPLLAELTLSGGRLALSGILLEQSAEVQQAYSAWYDFTEGQDEDGWVLLSAVRRNSAEMIMQGSAGETRSLR